MGIKHCTLHHTYGQGYCSKTKILFKHWKLELGQSYYSFLSVHLTPALHGETSNSPEFDDLAISWHTAVQLCTEAAKLTTCRSVPQFTMIEKKKKTSLSCKHWYKSNRITSNLLAGNLFSSLYATSQQKEGDEEGDEMTQSSTYHIIKIASAIGPLNVKEKKQQGGPMTSENPDT